MYAARLEKTLPRVRRRVAEAADRADRSPDEIRLVAITKAHPLEALEAALDAGIRDLGENRVGEMEEKVAALGERDVRWHMVGHVQRRKAPRLLPFMDLLHSLDSMRLARRFQRVADDGDAPIRALIQVNTSGEDSKGGFTPGNLLDHLPEILELGALRVEGLMTMAPLTDDEGVLRETFRGLRVLRDRALDRVEGFEGRELSMGMTNDYAIAVEEGATILRLGTALFGERPG